MATLQCSFSLAQPPTPSETAFSFVTRKTPCPHGRAFMYCIRGLIQMTRKIILIFDDFADKPASVFVWLPASRIGKDKVAVLSIRSIQPKTWGFNKSAGYCEIRKYG